MEEAQGTIIEGFELSPQQERLWRLLEAEPGSDYRARCVLRIEGELGRRRLEAALAAVVERNEVLHTAFRRLPGMDSPLQVVVDPTPPGLAELDLGALAESERERLADTIAAELARVGEDIGAGRVLNAWVVSFDPLERWLLVSLPALCADAATFDHLAEELTAELAGQSAVGGDETLQYIDLAEWQNELLEAEEGAEYLESWRQLWRERGLGARLAARLPLEEPSPAETGAAFEPAALALELGAELAGALADLARAWGAAVEDVVLAAWFAVHARGSGEAEQVVGVLHDGRRYEELEGVLGPFARYLPVICRVEPARGLGELVAAVRAAAGEVAGRQERFSWRHLESESGASGAFFPVAFEAAGGPRSYTADGVRLDLVRREARIDRFTVELALRGEGLLELRYDRRRLRRASAERLGERLLTLLGGVAERPEVPLAELEILGEGERALLERWAEAPVETPAEAEPRRGDLGGLLERQAAETPERIAVWHGAEALSYGELVRRARRLGGLLAGRGVGPEVSVALCFDRSVAMVEAVFGVLSAGGAWVPLDPTHPAERLAFVVRDVGARLLLTHGRLAETLPAEAETGVPVLTLDALLSAAGGEAPCADLSAGHPENRLAYAVYTSGSTGEPKGVMVEQGPPLRLLAGLEALLGEEADRGAEPRVVSLNAPLAFDASVQQLVQLLAGHTLVVIPEAVRTDGPALLGFLARRRIEVFDGTPSLLKILVDGGLLASEETVPATFLVAGEAIEPRMWRALAECRRHRFFNVYGPTEATVDATAQLVSPERPGPAIGQPLAGDRAWVLDRLLRPLPIGAPGEIVLGGFGLARGYVGRPATSAERFVPDPFAAEPGARLYRTGDLGRLRSGGELEFLGRIDHQVKLRGYRIELEEIEAVLEGHPAVAEAVVVVARDEAGEGVLVAYAVPGAGAPPRFAEVEGELHAFLRRSLPLYMVPAFYLPLAKLPLTASGKVDRRALAQRTLPARARLRTGAPVVAPRNEVEKALAEAWCEVLGIDEISIDDNFFALGGDSILSIQVVSRAARRGIYFAARQLFEHQTIATIAAVSETGERRVADDAPVVGPAPLTPIQLTFFEVYGERPEHFNQSLLLELAPGDLGPWLEPAALRTAWARILDHHDALRLRFEQREGTWSAESLAPGLEPALVTVDLSALAPDVRGAALTSAADRLQRSFDLRRPPLLRLGHFRMAGAEGGEGDRLLLIAHHLLIDGVSWRLLLEDFELLYRGRLAGEAPELPPKSTSYGRWSEALAEWARSRAGGEAAGFWLETAARVPGALPIDHETGRDDVASVAGVAVTLDEEETRALLQQVPAAYRTQIGDVLMTALAQSFAGFTGERRLWVELEGHGREEISAELDLSRTVGWFTSVFPVLLDLEGVEGMGEALMAVKETLRAVPERGLPFDVLRHLGDAELARRLAELPEPEVGFNYLGQLDDAVAEGRLFRSARESAGDAHDARASRPRRIEVNGAVSSGRLWLRFTYSRNRHRKETIEALAERFAESLRALIAHCLTPGVGGVTPSDFPLAGLDRPTLDRLAAAAGGAVDDVYPATPMQQGMIFHTLLAPGSAAHLGQFCLELQSELDLGAFRRAWRRLAERHAVLRTSFFGFELERSLQVVHARPAVPLATVDWSGLGASPAELEGRLDALLESDLRRGFDLARAPLVRLTLVRLGAEAVRLVWLHHHAILDGWSFPILLRELAALYAAERAARPVDLPRAQPFRDYVAWIERQDLAAAESYWRCELGGFEPPPPLGAGEAGDGEPPIFGTLWRAFGAETAEALRELARAHELTPNTIVQGVWAWVLGRYTGRGDVVFGIVSAGRAAPIAGIEEMVGLFINTLPVRFRMAPGERLGDWLRSSQERQAELRQYEYSPLAQVQRWAGAGGALFESLFTFENFPVDESVRQEAGSTLGLGGARTFEQSSYPLALSASAGARLSLRLVHDPRHFDRPSAMRLVDHVGQVLLGMLGGLDRPLGELSMLSRAERHQVTHEWNDTAPAEPPRAPTLSALVAARREGAPEAVALVADAKTTRPEHLSHGELGRRAGRLAHRLRALGVGPESIVAVSIERSPELIIALVGILETGAAYLPLDAAYPAERLELMVRDAGARVLVTHSGVPEVLEGLEGLERLELGGELGDELDELSESAGAPAARSESLAYVIYTSGSTGRPKGVAVPHGGVVNRLLWTERNYPLGPDDTVVLKASISFDFSVCECFGALASGARLVLARPGGEGDAAYLARLASAERVSVLHFVPSMLHLFVDEPLAAECRDLRYVLSGGEALARELAARFQRRIGAVLRNQYGPTELSIDTAEQPCPPVVPGPGSVPIGRPMTGSAIYLVDRWLRRVPAGAAGEMVVGGIGVVRGYLARAGLTAERFVPDPFSAAPGGRLYRTGDLARHDRGGSLTYLGRIDEQVKLRGFRVELGEIEAALTREPGISEAAAVIAATPAGERQIVAWVVGEGLDPAALRSDLARRLPGFMVPARVVAAEELPRTPSGKLDRRRLQRRGLELAAGETAIRERTGEVAAPRTPLEEIVAEVFAKILGRPAVGVDQDFFELGGHSLLATRVISRLQRAFGVDLPLAALFEGPTASELAARAGALLASDTAGVRPAVEPVTRSGAGMPLSFAQERLWFLEQLHPGTAAYNIPMALGLRGPLSRPALAAALSLVAARHETLRTTFVSVDGRARQVIAPPRPVVPPVIDLGALGTGERFATAQELARREAARPFDLERGPLLRTALLRLEDGHHVGLFTFHHAISDGWSSGVLVRELAAAYRAFRTGRSPELPPLPVQYADFAVWQRRWLEGGALAAQLGYWRERLAGAPEVLELPTDRPRPAAPSHRGAYLATRWPAAVAEGLAALGRRSGATLFMTVLAAFQAFLGRLAGQDDVVVGTPVAGRGQLELEGLIGFFVNTLALRAELDSEPSYEELIARARETALGAYAHQDVPLERLIDELGIERSLSHAPVFQTVFALQNFREEVVELGEISLEPLGSEARTAKFDLSLALAHTPQGLAGSWEYATDLFDTTTVLRTAARFERFLAALAERPGSVPARLELLSQAELHQLLLAWNDTAAEPVPGSVPAALAARAAETPEAIALEMEPPGGTAVALSYGELERRSARLARELGRRGFGPGALAALAAERSPGFLVGLWGIWRAGAAAVSLDPHLPPERLAFQLADSGVVAVVTDRSAAPRFDALGGGEHGFELLFADGPELASDTAAEAPSEPTDGLAYVIYTSGSTGVPKGVMIDHPALWSAIEASRQALGWQRGDRVSSVASQAFDIFLYEVLNPLAAGGRVRLEELSPVLDVGHLFARLDRSTRIFTVPALGRELISLARDAGGYRGALRTLISGGERVGAAHLEVLAETFPEAEHWVLYGPTETAIISTAERIAAPPAPKASLGRPLALTVTRVADRRGRLVPVGTAGELWIGGPGVMRGYLGRPGLTASVVVPDPWAREAGARLYRTGDRVRQRPDGGLEFLGRIDHQVKWRGFRIELGEIESALRSLAGVREALVLLRRDGGSDRLVAYAVAAVGEEPRPENLRGELERRLPSYMVPAAIVVLDELPLTAAGKVDRRALPAPAGPRGAGTGPAARDAAELALSAVWAEVLGVERVAIDDNFFELGGDSILSIQVVSRAARRGLKVTPRQIFEHQTLAELAAVAESAPAVEAEQGEIVGPAPLTPIQHWFFELGSPDPHHFNQPMLLAVGGDLEAALAERALAAVVAHHDALRLRFARVEGRWQPWHVASDDLGSYAFHHLDLRSADPAGGGFAAAARALQASLDLAAGPLVRGVWLELAGGERRWLLVVHHLVVDAVSWRVLLEDLETACGQLAAGEPLALPPKTTSYRHWAERLVEHATAAETLAELEWWRGELAAAEAGPFPDHPGGGNAEADQRRIAWRLSLEETRDLLQVVPAAYNTQIADVLLSALALALAGPGATARVAMEGHGREDILDAIDLSRTVGWFTIVYPVCLEVPAEGGLGAVLSAVKEHLRAIPRRGIGFGLLRYLGGGAAADLRAAVEPAVSFNYLGQLDQAVARGGLLMPAGESAGPAISPRMERPHALDVVAQVAGGRLGVSWSYSPHTWRPETVEGFAEGFSRHLRELIAHCREAAQRRTAAYTPSDFPLSGLTHAELDRALAGEWGIEDVYPLSPLQEGILFDSLYAPGTGVYVEQLLCRLVGELDPVALERACRRVIARHSVLRTAFRWQGLERPVQVVWEGLEVGLEQEDWRGLDRDDQRRRFDELIAADRKRGFDFARAPIMRWTLVRTGESEHRLLWTHHHLLLDGWSFGIVAEEFLGAYQALREGRAFEPPEARPYGEYVAWLERQDPEILAAYWRRRLADWSGPTPVPASRAEDPEATAPRLVWNWIDDIDGLQARARQHRLTLNTLVQGAWALVLARHSGESDVVFGATVSGRPPELPGIERMVGLFINTLPVRLRIAAGTPAVDWLRALQADQAEMRQFEHSPLVKVREWSRQSAGRPLFESILVFENYPRDEAMQRSGSESLGVADVEAIEQGSFPLGLMAAPGRRLMLRLSYDPRRFDGVTTRRLLGQLQRTIEALGEALGEGGGRPVGALESSTRAERHQLVVEWNDRAHSRFGMERRIDARVATWAAETGETVAAVYHTESDAVPAALSYGELEHRIRRLAGWLRRAGVGRGTIVGVLSDRSLDWLGALLAIWRAGGVYLPLDPGLPEERLELLAGDTDSPLILAADGLEISLGAAETRCMSLGSAFAEALAESPVDGVTAIDAADGPEEGDPAYLIYTSGSTGLPKGVAVRHRGLPYLAAGFEPLYRLGPETRLLQSAAPSFDGSVAHFSMTLSAGGTLVLAPRSVLLPGPGLAGLMRAERVSNVSLPPSVLAAMGDPGETELPDLANLVVAAEACPVELARAWARGRRLINAYGPTEATVCAVAGVWPGGDRLPLGRPLGGAEVYLLDRSGRPVPLGAAGELTIGGMGLAQGYLRRPALTAEKFVPHGFAAGPWLRPGARLYRSGDLARFLGSGELEFLGRIDRQVKIRGFRIELGEIEHALRALPPIEDAAVIVAEGAGGDRRLVAFLVGRGGSAPAVRLIRDALATRLPDYLVPAQFVMLDHMPLNSSGKVDRRLLERHVPAVGGEREKLAPRGPLEEVIGGMFAEVLRVERVGAEDDFFELGGHSLLATQVASRIYSAFKVELPLQVLFENATVASLARRVEALIRGAAGPEAPPVVPMPRTSPPPLSYAQERLWFLDQLNPGSPAYNISLRLVLVGPLDLRAFRAALTELAARHAVLRTRFPFLDGRPVQQIAHVAEIPMPLVDLVALEPERREEAAHRVAAAEALLAFDLALGPLVRASLLRLEGERHVILLTLHHSIADGWSMAILMREVAALYAAFREGRPSGLEPLEVQYADFAVWQRRWLAGEVLAEQIDYWRQHLEGAPEVLDLPLDRPRPPIQGARGAQVPVHFSPELSDALVRLGRGHGATLFMVVLAGFQALLARLCGEDDVVVGTPVANRNRSEIEGLIGFFVNTLALRGQLGDDPSFGDWLERLRGVALGAYAHQDLPFEKLVEELQPTRSPAHSPLFQVMLVLQNAPRGGVESSALRLEPFGGEGMVGYVRFDLTLSLTEGRRGIVGSLEYSTALFDRTTALRMARGLETLLAAAVGTPERRLSRLDVLAPAERHQLLLGWNDTARPEPAPRSLGGLVTAQAGRAPDTIAAVFGGEHLSYGELVRRSRRLGGRLRSLGAGPEARVGLSIARSLALPEAVLGIAASGAAYVALDPAYPLERLSFYLSDALSGEHRPLLVTTSKIAAALPRDEAFSALELVALDTLGDGQATASELPEPHPDHLAYVIYTSGSTGRPKGVAVSHRGLANLSAAQAREFRIGVGTRVLQFASLNFDASVSEMAKTWGVGGTLVLGSAERLLPGPSLASFARRERIEAATLPPSALALLPEDTELPALANLMVAGEACPEDTAEHFAANRRLINGYGPTETTVCISMKRYSGHGGLSVGRPLPNVEAHVLDRRGRPVLIGVAGELHAGGVGLARGYLGRPALTAESFVPHPFTDRPGARLYRTGDLARIRHDGEIELLGRVDRQIKLRGFRIEPGEIEAVLRENPAVRDAAVVARGDGLSTRNLGAWAVAHEGAELDTEVLRTELRARLPEAWMPAFILTLDALPLLPNGKVDRGTLASAPAPDQVSSAATVAPRTAMEAEVAKLFAEVLGLERVGVTQSFFDLGGHSLLAVSLVSRLEERFGHRLPLTVLFEGPSVAEVASRLEAPEDIPGWSSLVAMQPRGSLPPFFCAHPIGGGVGYYRELMLAFGDDQPFYGIQAAGLEEDEEVLEDPTIEEMAASYVREIRALQPAGPYILGGSSYGAIIAFEIAQQLRALGGEVPILALFDPSAPRPFDPGEDLEAIEIPEFDDAGHAFGMAVAVARMHGKSDELRLEIEDLRGLRIEKMMQVVLDRVCEIGLAEWDAEVDDLLRYRNAYYGRMRAAHRYRARPYDGNLLYFRALGTSGEALPDKNESKVENPVPIAKGANLFAEAQVGEAQVAEAQVSEAPDDETEDEVRDPIQVWRGIAQGKVEVFPVEGNHDSIVRQPYVGQLVDVLEPRIAELATRRGAAAPLDDHLAALGGESWAIWREAALRGAGFPAEGALRLAAPEAARAEERWATSDERFLALRDRARDVVRDALMAPRGEDDDLERRRALRRAMRRLGKERVPEDAAELLGAELAAELAAALTERESAREDYLREYDVGAEAVAVALRETAAEPRFREAVLWQNRSAFHAAVSKVAERPSDGGSQRRQHEALVARYLQRYSVKNDTIGFFGPVGWARLVDEGPLGAVRPGPELLAERAVYWESWTWEEIAKTLAERPEVRWELAPKRLPATAGAGEAELLRWCDGERSARQIAAELGGDAAEVFTRLEALHAEEVIDWGFFVPRDPHAHDLLREQIEAIAEPGVRRVCLEPLEELEAAREEVAAAAGDAERLDAALARLGEIFTRHTGTAATRRAGQVYAGRTLVYEDCRRDTDLELGPELLAQVCEPLTLLLESARWFSHRAADVFRAAARQLYTELARTAQGPVPALLFWQRLRPFFDGHSLDGVAEELQARWEKILEVDPGARQIELASTELRPRVEELFAAPGPGWQKARYHSPDLMIAAADADALERGEVELVLGEMHVGSNTLATWLMTEQHPEPAKLVEQIRRDLRDPLITISESREKEGQTRTNVVPNPDAWVVPPVDHARPIPEDRHLPVEELIVTEDGGEIRLETRDGEHRFDIAEAAGELLSHDMLHLFGMPDGREHWPRITIDRLVVSRETWRIPVDEPEFPRLGEPAERFAAARRWARDKGLPRWVFLSTPSEPKPLFMDFESPIAVEELARILRRDPQADGKRSFKVSEMLPALGQVWLPDAEGRVYTSELRLVVLDRTGR